MITAKGGEVVTYDYSKLKGRIVEVCETRRKFAARLGISYPTVLNKLASRTDFTQAEIERACAVLGISKTEIAEYFFTPRVKGF